MARNLTDIYVGVKQNDPSRNKNDLYRTPPLATFILQKYSSVPKTIVEPCAGYGNIAVELKRSGREVKCFDLYDYPEALCKIQTGTDVLKLPKQQDCLGLVTNPPYHKGLPQKIAEKALQEYQYVALLVRLTFLEGKKRKLLFERYPPTQLLIFSDRIQFNANLIEPVEKNQQIGGMISYVWIIWDKTVNLDGLSDLRWISLDAEYDEWKEQYILSKEG